MTGWIDEPGGRLHDAGDRLLPEELEDLLDLQLLRVARRGDALLLLDALLHDDADALDLVFELLDALRRDSSSSFCVSAAPARM